MLSRARYTQPDHPKLLLIPWGVWLEAICWWHLVAYPLVPVIVVIGLVELGLKELSEACGRLNHFLSHLPRRLR